MLVIRCELVRCFRRKKEGPMRSETFVRVRPSKVPGVLWLIWFSIRDDGSELIEGQATIREWFSICNLNISGELAGKKGD